jgi:hypothetical protein
MRLGDICHGSLLKFFEGTSKGAIPFLESKFLPALESQSGLAKFEWLFLRFQVLGPPKGLRR